MAAHRGPLGSVRSHPALSEMSEPDRLAVDRRWQAHRHVADQHDLLHGFVPAISLALPIDLAPGPFDLHLDRDVAEHEVDTVARTKRHLALERDATLLHF